MDYLTEHGTLKNTYTDSDGHVVNAIFASPHTLLDDTAAVKQYVVYECKEKENYIVVGRDDEGQIVEMGQISATALMEAWWQKRQEFEAEQQRVAADASATVGLTPNVTVRGINDATPWQGLVDTGAEYCSMHVDSVETIGNEGSRIMFVIGGNRFIADVQEWYTVSSANGTERRPGITIGVSVYPGEAQVPIQAEVIVNLCDRSNMEQPFLIGRNFLDAVDIKIDPSLKEMTNFDALSMIEEYVVYGQQV